MEMRLAAPVTKGYFFLSALPRLVDSASPRTISIDKKKSSGTQESEFPHLKWPRGKKGDRKLICMFIISARVTEPKGIWVTRVKSKWNDYLILWQNRAQFSRIRHVNSRHLISIITMASPYKVPICRPEISDGSQIQKNTLSSVQISLMFFKTR